MQTVSLERRALFAAWRASVDVDSPSRWRSGDGKIISVAEENIPYLRDLSQTRQGPGPKKNNVDQKRVNIWRNETPDPGTNIYLYISPRLALKIASRYA